MNSRKKESIKKFDTFCLFVPEIDVIKIPFLPLAHNIFNGNGKKGEIKLTSFSSSFSSVPFSLS